MGKPIVGFANGVFDCFHGGHRHFLRECKMNCDALVVAVNRHVERARDPVAERMGLVMSYADSVRSFDDEEELLAIMRDYKPDVIFKGEDYYGKPITGGDLARIHWVARHAGYSSSIERTMRALLKEALECGPINPFNETADLAARIDAILEASK